jgi:tetratricopeptide (TPR) repeat protein
MNNGRIYKVGGRVVQDVPEFVSELFSQKKYDECFLACEKILEKDSKNDLALLYMGAVFTERKEYENALSCLYRFTLRMPEFYSGWLYKGRCEIRLKQYEEAKISFLELVKRNGKSGVSWAYLALTYVALRKPEAGVYCLDQSKEFVTEGQEAVDEVRIMILEDTNPDEAILFLHILEMSEKDENKKQEYGKQIYNLVLKNADPTRRSGIR